MSGCQTLRFTVLVLGLALAGGWRCASMSTHSMSEARLRKAGDLRSAQIRESGVFEELRTGLTAGHGRCGELCGHRDQICRLAERICDIAKVEPGARPTCDKASETCQETGRLMPAECQCADAGDLGAAVTRTCRPGDSGTP